MANIVQVECNNMLDASLAKATYTATTSPIKLRLMTANGSSTSAGTEVTGGSYAAVDIQSNMSSASAGASANSAAINFTSMPAVTVTGVEIWDSNGTPKRKWFGALTASKTTNSGDTLSFAIGSLTVAIS